MESERLGQESRTSIPTPEHLSVLQRAAEQADRYEERLANQKAIIERQAAQLLALRKQASECATCAVTP